MGPIGLWWGLVAGLAVAGVALGIRLLRASPEPERPR
jgi:Na+-driven multidrug efflux pump